MDVTRQKQGSNRVSMQSMSQPNTCEPEEWLRQRMKITKAAFPNSALTPETAAVYLSEWALIVEQIGQDSFELALTAAMRASRFFPTIAEISEHAGLNVAAEKKLKIQAEQAWEWVQTYIRKWINVPGNGEFLGLDS